MIWEFGSVAKQLLLPPLGLGWLLLLAWLLVRRRPGLARWLLALFAALLLLLSLPPVSTFLIRSVEMESAASRFGTAHAIVMLGGGRRLAFDAAGKVIDSGPGLFTLERVHAGARLAKQTGLPVLLSSGKPDGFDPTEAEVMREMLARDFGVEARWLEDESRNTVENAEFTARILLPQKVRRIILVTSAFHMRRSLLAFERAGFVVLPAPVNPISSPPVRRWGDYVPNAPALLRSYYAFNEMGGIVYAHLRMAETPSATVGN